MSYSLRAKVAKKKYRKPKSLSVLLVVVSFAAPVWQTSIMTCSARTVTSMSGNTQNTLKRIGRLVRNNFPKHNPELPTKKLESTYLLAYAKLRMVEFARDVAMAKNKHQTVIFAAEMLELLGLILSREEVSFDEVVEMSARLNDNEGNYSEGLIVLEKTYEPEIDSLEYWIGDEEA